MKNNHNTGITNRGKLWGNFTINGKYETKGITRGANKCGETRYRNTLATSKNDKRFRQILKNGFQNIPKAHVHTTTRGKKKKCVFYYHTISKKIKVPIVVSGINTETGEETQKVINIGTQIRKVQEELDKLKEMMCK